MSLKDYWTAKGRWEENVTIWEHPPQGTPGRVQAKAGGSPPVTHKPTSRVYVVAHEPSPVEQLLISYSFICANKEPFIGKTMSSGPHLVRPVIYFSRKFHKNVCVTQVSISMLFSLWGDLRERFRVTLIEIGINEVVDRPLCLLCASDRLINGGNSWKVAMVIIR